VLAGEVLYPSHRALVSAQNLTCLLLLLLLPLLLLLLQLPRLSS
jgi:hypothetical protein